MDFGSVMREDTAVNFVNDGKSSEKNSPFLKFFDSIQVWHRAFLGDGSRQVTAPIFMTSCYVDWQKNLAAPNQS